MAVNFNTVTDITIPEGNVTKIEDSNGDVVWSKISTFDLLATCVNKGWRSTTNNINGVEECHYMN